LADWETQQAVAELDQANAASRLEDDPIPVRARAEFLPSAVEADSSDDSGAGPAFEQLHLRFAQEPAASPAATPVPDELEYAAWAAAVAQAAARAADARSSPAVANANLDQATAVATANPDLATPVVTAPAASADSTPTPPASTHKVTGPVQHREKPAAAASPTRAAPPVVRPRSAGPRQSLRPPVDDTPRFTWRGLILGGALGTAAGLLLIALLHLLTA